MPEENEEPSEPEIEPRPASRKIWWVSLIWGLLIAKSIILTALIHHYDSPIAPFWIWGPSMIAAALLSVYILKPRG